MGVSAKEPEPTTALESPAEQLHRRIEALSARAAALSGMVTAAIADSRAARAAAGACSHAAEVQALQREVGDVRTELDGLRVAMKTRAVIEQAKGMLMISRHIEAEEAWTILVHLSQTSHRKLVDVATAVVETWGGS